MTEEKTKENSEKEVETEQVSSEEIKKENELQETPENEVENDDDTPVYEPPKPVERVIKHPKSDVVRSPDSDLDTEWGFAIEFTTAESLEPVWNKLKEYLEKHGHPLSGKANWLSLDPRGYFSPRLRHFITITGWGMQIESVQDWFTSNISEIKKPVKIIEASEELAEENWQGYIVKDNISLIGSKFIKLESFSRNKRNLVIESKKPVPSSLPRYWTQNPVFSVRDYLIPFIHFEKHNEGISTPESYLEEYIVEQLEWMESESKDKYVVLPEVFKSDSDQIRGIEIPEEYTPEMDFSNMGGMFPGMGGMGGLPGMDGLGDLAGMEGLGALGGDDVEDSEINSEENDSDVIDAEIIEENKED